ncbi:reverse transcriptase-like protein [Sphingobium yanoikuyae]|jgi:ribonuclease HI|uniref:reverse transcriptase-like protein n=1 Tax=Sphingobium yanoikuyae TaxID=13690 RepID=UPI000AF25857|nr:reverse transcriptase-like protein [Sphingobium yanoikuyae]
MKITPHGTLHRLSNGQNLMTAFVDGVAFDQVICSNGSSTEAAYIATECALRFARAIGARSVTIFTSSGHVVHQMNGYWRTRKRATRRMRDRCRSLCDGMKVTFQF